MPAPADLAAFVAASRFMALATVGAEGRADVSPKGDPAGCMAQLDGDRLWFADRPGNRRVDSFRNIVDQPQAALALLVPGATAVVIVRGRGATFCPCAGEADETFLDEIGGVLPRPVTRKETK